MLFTAEQERKSLRVNAEFSTIKKIVNQVSIPVVANGDIDSPKKAQDIINFTGAEAVMLGRATQGNPWLINQINEFLTKGSNSEEPPLEKKIPQILKSH